MTNLTLIQTLFGDERCILDPMRLTDPLLVLLMDGRAALPKAVCPEEDGQRGREDAQTSHQLHQVRFPPPESSTILIPILLQI